MIQHIKIIPFRREKRPQTFQSLRDEVGGGGREEQGVTCQITKMKIEAKR